MKKLLIPAFFLAPLVAFAASTFTTNYNLEKPQDGSTSWGPALRDNFDTIDTQLDVNATDIDNHLADAVGAHASTAISTPGGTYCPAATTVEAYLDCLDEGVTIFTGGAVLPIASGGTNNSSAYTAGSVIFSNGSSLTQDNSGLYWDDTNNRMGIGSSSPSATLEIRATAPYVNTTAATGTNVVYYRTSNTGGAAAFGTEGSAGGQLATGASSYSTVIGNDSARELDLFTNGAVRVKVGATGALSCTAYGTGVFHSNSVGDITSSTIVNADVSASAAIAYSKLALTGAVLNADLAGSIADSKLSQITTASKVSTSALTGTLAAGVMPALTGDITTSAGAVATTLATVNSNVGSFGSTTAIPNITVNGKGLVTAASTSAVVAPAGTLTGTTLAANVVSSSLTSVGTIGTGVWSGTAITNAKGGTGGDSSGSTGLAKVSGGTWSYATLLNADVNASAAIALSKLAATTASRALVSDGSGFVSPATTTATEVGYLNGVTSAIQTQLNLLAPKASPTFTGTVTAPFSSAGVVNTTSGGVLGVSIRPSLKYTSSSGQSFTSGSDTVVNFGTQVHDSHSTVTNPTTAWLFTVPASAGGVYHVAAQILFDAGTSANTTQFQMILRKNGVQTDFFGYAVGTGGNINFGVGGSTSIRLVPTDTLDVIVNQNTGGARTLITNVLYNHIAIEKVAD